MSAEVLRRATSLMRERAEAADALGKIADKITTSECVEFAEHIASWHPAVALAVADWLDTAGADLWAHGPLCECGSGCHECDDSLWQPHVRRALAVARAYLGDPS